MKGSQSPTLSFIADLKDEFKGYKPVSISIGQQYEALILLTEEYPSLLNGSFPPTIMEKPYKYRIIQVKDGKKTVLGLADNWNFHFVQTIDTDHILLVGARSVYHNADNIEENARVFDKNGQFIRSFCLGDGLEHVQVSENNRIWTGYFDEGTCGNYGWDHPIGSSGLVGWNHLGDILETHESDDFSNSIFECLALNITADDEVWFFFSLSSNIGVKKDGRTSYYTPEKDFFHSFAVEGDTLVVYQEYGEQTGFFEMKKDGEEFKVVCKLDLLKADGTPVIPLMLGNRGNMLLFLEGTELYTYKVEEKSTQSPTN